MGIFFLVTYGMPVLILVVAAALGVFCARYFRGHPESEDARLVASIWLAILLPVVASFSVLTPTFSEIQKLYGGFVSFLWLWALICFGIGVVFGWSSCERAAPKGGKR